MGLLDMLLGEPRSVAGQFRPRNGAPFNEPAFQDWYRGWADLAGINPNPDAPGQMYDYRAAYTAGLGPTINEYDGRYHWPDVSPSGERLKDINHPTYWMEDFMQKTGIAPEAILAAALLRPPGRR